MATSRLGAADGRPTALATARSRAGAAAPGLRRPLARRIRPAGAGQPYAPEHVHGHVDALWRVWLSGSRPSGQVYVRAGRRRLEPAGTAAAVCTRVDRKRPPRKPQREQ